MKVLFMSGYTDHALMHRELDSAGTAFLQKPFTPEVFARKVRHVLDSRIRRAAGATCPRQAALEHRAPRARYRSCT